jgi:hypothetical protein
MNLKIAKAEAELKNVNIRTENNGDERVLACDLKIKANISATEAKPLFQDTPKLIGTLFDSAGNVLNPVFEMKYRMPIENIELALDDRKYKGGKIKKNMRLIPRNGSRFEVMLTVQLTDVKDIRPMAARLHEEVKVTIIERQQSLNLTQVA